MASATARSTEPREVAVVLSREEQEELHYFVDCLREWLGLHPLFDKSVLKKTDMQRFPGGLHFVTVRTGRSTRYEAM